MQGLIGGFFWRLASACSPFQSRRIMNTNGRLISVLDAAAADASPGQPEVMLVDEQNNPAAYEAYVAKARAEADAQDKANRLRVAQEQLAEYAAQKEKDAADLLQQADAVQQIISSALQKGALSPDLLQSVEQLRVKVSEYAAEASAFAAQQKADVETLKRSSHQADLPAGNMDADMKRAREGAEAEGDDSAADDGQPTASTSMEDAPMANGAVVNFKERARYIPLRLTQDERRLLRLLEAALNVSEYTDKVDILSWRSKNQRVLAQIKDICAILSGLVVAQDYKRGQELIRDRDFKTNEDFFQDVFEAGRRYKIMNPEKMRSEYGKLMYMLMDSSDSTIQDLLEFNCVRPLKTVYAVLEAKGGIKMLDDPLMEAATAEIVAGDRPRYEVQRDIKVKEKARETLARRYKSSQLAEEDILQCLYAISDNNTFLFFNRDPIDRMIAYFTTYFKHDSHEPGYSLAIQGGREGARLTHNHERQYSYVLQSLTLWREISTDMFRLWYLAEQDMLRDSNGYRLVDTGQGLNRVQSAPSVSKAMHQILARCQARIGSWVGSSVVHLGDHNVPNALHFIDKYTQVPRILNPVVLVLDALPKICRDPNIAQYIDNTFGGLEQCRKTIMVDFCRHAFDGSGADNFFDAGSCIDGRLTSAWNWCSKIEKKAYYPVFKLAGFNGFDGDFK